MNIPEGFKLVPVEPTDEMLSAMWSVMHSHGASTKVCYESMLAAAPTPPQPIYDEVKERELFEQFAVNRRGGYGHLPFFIFARKENGQYNDGTAELAWEGWLACAQSRAKSGELGHE